MTERKKVRRNCIYAICHDEPNRPVCYFYCKSTAYKHLQYLKKENPDMHLFILVLDVISTSYYNYLLSLGFCK